MDIGFILTYSLLGLIALIVFAYCVNLGAEKVFHFVVIMSVACVCLKYIPRGSPSIFYMTPTQIEIRYGHVFYKCEENHSKTNERFHFPTLHRMLDCHVYTEESVVGRVFDFIGGFLE